jgi:hypothetical protein
MVGIMMLNISHSLPTDMFSSSPFFLAKHLSLTKVITTSICVNRMATDKGFGESGPAKNYGNYIYIKPCLVADIERKMLEHEIRMDHNMCG